MKNILRLGKAFLGHQDDFDDDFDDDYDNDFNDDFDDDFDEETIDSTDIFESTMKSSQVSFGNRYDDRTMEFVEMMKEYNVDIPSSVNYSSNDNVVTMDRHSGGGMTSIDKSICRTRIESAYDNGKISKDIYDRLISKLNSC